MTLPLPLDRGCHAVVGNLQNCIDSVAVSEVRGLRQGRCWFLLDGYYTESVLAVQGRNQDGPPNGPPVRETTEDFAASDFAKTCEEIQQRPGNEVQDSRVI